MAEVPPAATTVTSTGPADPAGAVTVMDVVELTVRPIPGVAPKFTAETLVKFVPVMLTETPLVSRPAFGLTAVTVGAAKYVKPLDPMADVPEAFVTVIWTVPLPPGETAVIDEVEFTVKLVAGTPPNFTELTAE